MYILRGCSFRLLTLTFGLTTFTLFVILCANLHPHGDETATFPDVTVVTDLLRDNSPNWKQFIIHFRKCAVGRDIRQKSDEGKVLNCFLGAVRSVQDKTEGRRISFPRDPVHEFLSRPVINLHNPNYIINASRACANRVIETLFVTPSAPGFFQRRQEVRNSNRGDYVKNTKNNATLVFFVGMPEHDIDGEVVDLVKHEAETYGDIVLVRLVDKYKNILQKALAMLRWAIDFCPTADHVIRTDDDVNVTVTNLVSVMKRKRRNYPNFVIGRRKVNDVPARSHNKWHLSRKEYAPSRFPPYVLGGLIGYPMTTVRLLYEASLRLKSIWLDDVYITGLCTQKLNIPVLEDKLFDFTHVTKSEDFDHTVS